MTRAGAAALAALLATASLAALVTGSLALARRAAPAAAPAAAALAPAAPRPTERLCIHGAGAAATAAAATRAPLLHDGRIDAASLAAVSSLAFTLERTIERVGSTIPQRSGLDATGAPLAPTPTCADIPVPSR